MEKIRVGIINVTGYIGAELARILCQHEGVELASVTGRTLVGRRLGEVFPHLSDIRLVIESELKEVDFAFSALPHGASAEPVARMLEKDVRVVDLSADFRLKDVAEYQRWYQTTHSVPELLNEAVYGLPEINRGEISQARLVANPGCYPTGAILALAPAVKAGLISPGIIIDSKSGVSGAGRTLNLNTHFSEANENTSAYALEGHRHLPEIVQELRGLSAGFQPQVTFLPHLVPMTRGILSSCYAELAPETSPEKLKKEIRELYQEFYRDEPFVRVVDSPPGTKQTWGSNLCLLYPTVDVRAGRLVVVSCLDNLVKGGAGQAVQNFNLMMGFPETMGLTSAAVYP